MASKYVIQVLVVVYYMCEVQGRYGCNQLIPGSLSTRPSYLRGLPVPVNVPFQVPEPLPISIPFPVPDVIPVKIPVPIGVPLSHSPLDSAFDYVLSPAGLLTLIKQFPDQSSCGGVPGIPTSVAF